MTPNQDKTAGSPPPFLFGKLVSLEKTVTALTASNTTAQQKIAALIDYSKTTATNLSNLNANNAQTNSNVADIANQVVSGAVGAPTPTTAAVAVPTTDNTNPIFLYGLVAAVVGFFLLLIFKR